jgi:hypothetical protein
VQRYISTKQTIAGADSFMSDEEKKQLLEIAQETYENELSEELQKIDDESRELQIKVDQVKEKLKNDN